MIDSVMTNRKRFGIILLLCFGIVIVYSLIIASTSERFLFTEHLRVEEYVSDNTGSLSATVFRGDSHVANINIQLGLPFPQSDDIPIQLSIWHIEEIELDSLSLKLYGTDYLDVYMEAPSASWPPYTFRRAEDGKGILFQVENLGVLGVGTVVIRFLLTNLPDDQSLYFEATCSMHTKVFLQLTRQELWTYTEIPLPK